MKLPLNNNKAMYPQNSKCPICNKKFNGDVICFNSGALMKCGKDSACLDKRLIGFGSFSKHYDSIDKYKTIMMIDNAPNGQCDVYTCSTKCMKKLFNNIISQLGD